MADALVSTLVSTILENLNASALQELGVVGNPKTELANLQSTLSTIRAVLHDAEKKQWKSEAVKNWLRKLKGAAYDADDVVEEFKIEAPRRRLPRDLKNRVRSFFSRENPLVFRLRMAHKLKNVMEKLEAIARERNFHLTAGVDDSEADSLDWRQTSSLVNDSEIYGRKEEKEELINKLLTNSGDLSVYAIRGMGGLGKTTLAQLIYNDGRVKSHFNLRGWVCVSDNFHIRRLARAIIESIDGTPCNNEELDPLLRSLQEKLSGKKFLLVLDDVWDDDHDTWNGLKIALRSGVRGSAVIVTTRIEKVAVMMATDPIHPMEGLSDDDSWSLFQQHAFEMGNREEYVHLEASGKAIVKKCGGVPLAIKALGRLLHLKRGTSEWESIKESEIWDLPDEGSGILPALRLSYENLRPDLRQCFAFCSIFPKDYVMEKDQLVGLWMANGFISRRGPKDLYDVGHEIFSELVWRSFFQEVEEDVRGNITCKMHDLVHDLAQSIAKHECCLIKPNTVLEGHSKVRHLAAYGISEETVSLFKDLLEVQSLRTVVLPSGMGPLEPYLCGKKHLRALDVSRTGLFIIKLPKSIGNLKFMRYLDLSDSDIITLPESLISLQNVETLNLRRCYRLRELPEGMEHMKSLTQLDIRGCYSLACMPTRIGQLTCLRKLSMFIVGTDTGRHIGELQGLNLGGELHINNLDNVKSLTEAQSSKLICKQNLQSLSLNWQGNSNGSMQCREIEEVLCGLQPHSNLKDLSICKYRGQKSPDWMSDLSLRNVVNITLEDCDRCECLPALGKLPSLKYLWLERLCDVKYIDSEVYGDGENPFPSLETLWFYSMPSLEKWATVSVGRRDLFPRLRELAFRDCPKLVEFPIIPSVKELKIMGGNEMLLRSVMKLPSLTSLKIERFDDLAILPDGMMQEQKFLESFEISSLRNLESLSNQLGNISALKYLYINGCGKLENLPEELRNLKSLEVLNIFGCGLVSLPINGLCGLSSLRELRIEYCARFGSLSDGIRHLTALEKLRLNNCGEMNSLPKSIHHLTSLRILEIVTCRGLTCLPNQIGNLASLSHLTIIGCGNLMSLPEGVRDLASLSHLEIIGCGNLMSLPDGVRELQMLRELKICGCPNLPRQCQKEGGDDSPIIDIGPPPIAKSPFFGDCKFW